MNKDELGYVFISRLAAASASKAFRNEQGPVDRKAVPPPILRAHRPQVDIRELTTDGGKRPAWTRE
jgi:hypothetical protein